MIIESHPVILQTLTCYSFEQTEHFFVEIIILFPVCKLRFTHFLTSLHKIRKYHIKLRKKNFTHNKLYHIITKRVISLA
jgi:hypothetical protein